MSRRRRTSARLASLGALAWGACGAPTALLACGNDARDSAAVGTTTTVGTGNGAGGDSTAGNTSVGGSTTAGTLATTTSTASNGTGGGSGGNGTTAAGAGGDDGGTTATGTGGDGGSGGNGTTATGTGGTTCDMSACPSDLTLFVLFDLSRTMSCELSAASPYTNDECDGLSPPRKDLVTAGLQRFFEEPESAGIDVGLGYFGYMNIGETECDPSYYASPAVPIAADNTEFVLASLNAALPVGETATGPGIRGTCDYLQGWYEDGGQGKVLLLLITGNVPEAPASADCNPTVEDAALAASECLEGQPRIETYVLAVGQDLTALHPVAAAGGTDTAHLVDGSQGEPTDAIVSALQSIRDQALER